MGTHPIFESDFDCLTESCFAIEVAHGIRRRRCISKEKTEIEE